MTDDAVRAAVEAADTYQAAAVALGMPYPKLYAAARRLGVRPKNKVKATAKRAPAVALPPGSFRLRDPAPEPTPPHLGPWIPPPTDLNAKPGVVAVRLDQAGRVRAEIDDLRDHWCGWAVRDVTGAVVGKVGLCAGIRAGEARQKAEEGADHALVKLGWLPAGHTVATETCAVVAPACTSEPTRP